MKLSDKNLYYIGGIVRDELIGKESFDVDLTYVGDGIDFVKNNPDIEILKVNESFGTVRVKFDNQIIDIASTRSEIYPQKGHLPVVDKIGCSLKEDVMRRDFTINSLAKSTCDGNIIDYTGGLEDIKSKIIRVLHDGSFIDDPTRIIRALKFCVRFGFNLDEHTKDLQIAYLKNVNYDMSYKRLKKELEETFDLNIYKAFEIFCDNGLYKLFTTAEFIKPKFDFSSLISEYNIKHPWIIYMGLVPDVDVLPLTKVEKNIINSFRNLITLNYSSDFEIYKNLSNVPIESVIMFSTVDSDSVLRYFNYLKDIKISFSGADLIKSGISPSKNFQKCFDYILKAKLENPNMTKSEELNLALKFFN